MVLAVLAKSHDQGDRVTGLSRTKKAMSQGFHLMSSLTQRKSDIVPMKAAEEVSVQCDFGLVDYWFVCYQVDNTTNCLRPLSYS